MCDDVEVTDFHLMIKDCTLDDAVEKLTSESLASVRREDTQG